MTRPALRRPAGTEQRATSLELFYDLVFVFAVTQVSHHLLGDLTWRGAGQSAFLLLVVWWSWNYTTWVTNELDPESPVVRLLMIALMLAGRGPPTDRAEPPEPADGRGDARPLRRAGRPLRRLLPRDPDRPALVLDVRRGGPGGARGRARPADPRVVLRRRSGLRHGRGPRR